MKKKIFLIITAALLLIVCGTVCAAGSLFQEELKITGSIEKVSDEKPVYFMEVEGDYYFEEFLSFGGAASDEEVSAFLTEKISKGFYSVDVKDEGRACSTISAENSDGTHIWGRNFDWTGAVPIIVKCVPQDGYTSISTCDFQNITGSPDTVPEDFINKMLAIAALYVPLDGVNEAGLCVADLEVNEGGMVKADTEKPDLTVTTAIRLILNKAATVDEAIELLRQYDIHASGGISHHIAVSDASGASAVIEFVNGEIVVVNTNCVTNFNLANGDTAAGGESAEKRYEYLDAVYKENKGILNAEQIKNALSQVSQPDGKWRTQWSVVYEQAALTVSYYFDCNYTTAVSYSVSD